MIIMLFIILSLSLSAEPQLDRTDVFTAGKDGYFAYRIPAIEIAPDGSLLAFAEGRKHNLGDPGFEGNDIDLVLKRSTDGGRQWSPMRIIEDPGEGWSAGNPVTVVDRQTGRVWLFYLRCKPGRNTDTARPGTDDSQILARTSDDSGASWSEPVDLTSISRDLSDPKWRCSVAGPGGGIQMRDGRLVIPMWKFEPWGVFALFSEDHGKTWQRGSMAPELEGDECQAVELADGTLLLDVRQHSGPNRWFTQSADGGRTWSKSRPGEKVTPVCCAIERWPRKDTNNDLLLWTGPRGAGRSNLVVRISRDQAKTFTLEKEIASGPAAYSDLTILKDGDVGVFWERGEVQGYQFITFSRFNMEWVQATNTIANSNDKTFKTISRGDAAGTYQAFPDICRLADGSLFCVFYGGYGHISPPKEGFAKGGRICRVKSTDEGRTWSEPRILFDGLWDDRDPHIAQMKDGTLFCSFFTYRQTNGPALCDTCIVSSSDGGETWDAEAQVVAPDWPSSAPVRELPDGTRLLGVYHEEGTNAYGGVIRSEKGSRVWSLPIPIDKNSGVRLDAETDFFLRLDGTLYAALRGDKVNMHYATSADAGLTWSAVKDIGFAGHCPHFNRLRSGEVILAHRLPMTSIHVSRDDGRTWQGPFQIDSTIGAYPSTVELKDGSVLIVFYEEGSGSGIRGTSL